MSEKMSEKDIELNKLVEARIAAMPSGVGVSIGSFGVIEKNDLIEHIKNNDEIGKKFVEMDWHFLQSIKSGSMYDEILEYVK